MAMEIERKFLVDTAIWTPREPGTLYRQGYLSSLPERSVRVRIAGDFAFLTVKGATKNISRIEFEYSIPLADAEALLDLCEPALIEKTRHSEYIGDRLWEIDVFHGDNHGLIVAEIELASEAETFERPNWLGAEVSHDPRYFNLRLSKAPFKSWSQG